jgi:ribosomal protein S18 acetylase RimI-like enzyme
MHFIRPATEADASLIARQRVKMFQDNGLQAVGTWESLEQDSAHWTAAKLRDGSYAGWIVEEGIDERPETALLAIGGAGLWLMEWPPHILHSEPMRGYLLNFYVSPHARGKGIARELVRLAVEESRRRGIHVATLHASRMGRPVYESLGWIDSNEMLMRY